MPSEPKLTYKDAGVDIDAGAALVERIKPAVKRTLRPEVIGGLGGFGGLFRIPAGYREPVLVAGTDGVGTKVALAIAHDAHDGIGVDLVAMCANDVLVQGAEPLFFLDYFATPKLDVATAERVIAGIARGCEAAGAALLGGETAEHPGMHRTGEYDLAGFCVGIVENDRIIDGRGIEVGHTVIGLASSGVHANGFSLIRRVLEHHADDLHRACGETTLIDALLTPTRIYVRPLLRLLGQMRVDGIAHITGGGLVENVPRVLPEGLGVRLDASRWTRPPVFDWLERRGVGARELYSTFNCGIGMVVIVAPQQADAALRHLHDYGEQAWVIGEVVPAVAGRVEIR